MEGRGRERDNPGRQLTGPDGLGEVHRQQVGSPVRIWSPAYLGNTHNPDAFTAGWNLCYMPFWAGMLTEDQHPHPELQAAIRQASWDLYFSGNPQGEVPDFVSNPGINLAVLLNENPLRVLHWEPRDAAPEPTRQTPRRPRARGATLPITLDPPNSEDFLDALLRTKKAWIQVNYQDGRTEVQPWNAGNMSPTSNVIGNLRSRPEFRSNAWQKNGIASLRVTIQEPGTDGNPNPAPKAATGWRRPLSQFFRRRDAGNQYL